MKILLQPMRNPLEKLDVTDRVIDVIAAELGKCCGGNATLNRLEAAAHLSRFVDERIEAARATHRAPAETLLRHSRK